jgi:hypothetical protein
MHRLIIEAPYGVEYLASAGGRERLPALPWLRRAEGTPRLS